MDREEIDIVLEILENIYKGAKCGLDYETPYQLLISTILSAQCTDERVNKVCSELYNDYGTPQSINSLSEEELEIKIKSCGFYKNKSKNILGATKIILEKYKGEVPSTMEELIKLPGVGRKTANVVLSNAFHVPAIAVDTHVFRVSNRIGIAKAKNVEKVEQQLMTNIPRQKWSNTHHYLIWHGRKICKARKPNCEICPLVPHCEYYRSL